MVNSHPLQKGIASPEHSTSSQSRKAHRRRTQRAKKKALHLSSSSSLSNNPANPANPAISSQAPPPPPTKKLKPRTKPQITKPNITKPSITFGIRVSDLILRDTIALCAPARVATAGNGNGNGEMEGESEDNENQKEKALPQTPSSRMALHGKTVLSLANLPPQRLNTIDKTPITKPLTLKASPPYKNKYESEYNTSTTFPYASLPPELRLMISTQIFTSSSGSKPRFLWALKGNKELYAEAKEVWLKTNEFGFTYQESGLNRIREGMSETEKRMVRFARLEVSKDIQACTLFHPSLLLFPSLANLTLHIYTAPSFSLSVHHIIPSLHSLTTLNIQIHSTSKQRLALHAAAPFSQSDNLLAEFFRSFVKTREVVDRMLGKKGKCTVVGRRMQVWGWEAEKGEVFRPRCAKVHIRFDEENREFALEAEGEQDSGLGS